MQHVKKYLAEGLIRCTIVLSLIGVRVDVDTYFSAYLSPLLEIDVGPSSGYARTPFHNLGDGYSLHPKCPDLESCFRSRRLLDEVRALGSPRFPTQLSAWLVHLVPTDSGGRQEVAQEGAEEVAQESVTHSGVEDCRGAPEDRSQSAASDNGTRPCPGGTPKEGLHGDGTPLLAELPVGPEPLDRDWQDFLSLSAFDDLDLTSAISQDVSLQDAMVTDAMATRRAFRTQSSDSSHSWDEVPRSSAGFLDESVFEQINLLGLGLEGVTGLEGVACLGGMACLEGRDSDSGLSLGSGSRSPSSPGPSEASSGRREGGAGRGGVAKATGEWAESVRHNHTYPARPLLREVKREVLSEEEEEEEEEESRDERRARALGIPVSVPEVVAMPVEDFLSLVGGRGLSAPQVSLLRDIRRRGKNKLAARSCRRRRVEAVGRLEGEVEALERERAGLRRERAQRAEALARLARRLGRLSRLVLAQLRDERGRPLCPARHALHCAPDGSVTVLPRGHAHHSHAPRGHAHHSHARPPRGPRPERRKKGKKH